MCGIDRKSISIMVFGDKLLIRNNGAVFLTKYLYKSLLKHKRLE